MRDLAKWTLVIVAVAAVVGGLYATGGPQAARVLKRDVQRLDDLLAIKERIDCLAYALDEGVPETFDHNDLCDWEVPLADPFTGSPYVYEKLTDTAYKLCAEFENPERLIQQYGPNLSIETGCITWALDH